MPVSTLSAPPVTLHTRVTVNSIISSVDYATLALAGTIVRIKQVNGSVGCAVKIDTPDNEENLWSVAGLTAVTNESLLSLGAIIVVWTPEA